MCEIEKNQPPKHEELMDEELLKLGVRFTDRTKEIPENAEFEPMEDDAETPSVSFSRVGRVASRLSTLVAADSLLMFMCMAEKIELAYGLVFLAAASAFFGARVSNARL